MELFYSDWTSKLNLIAIFGNVNPANVCMPVLSMLKEHGSAFAHPCTIRSGLNDMNGKMRSSICALLLRSIQRDAQEDELVCV